MVIEKATAEPWEVKELERRFKKAEIGRFILQVRFDIYLEDDGLPNRHAVWLVKVRKKLR